MADLRFNFVGEPKGPLSQQFAEALEAVLLQKGYSLSENPDGDVVFGFFGPWDSAWMVRDAITDPRNQKPVAVVEYPVPLSQAAQDERIKKIWELWDPDHGYIDEVLALTYPQLSLKLAPEVIALFPGELPEIVCTGMEGSHVRKTIRSFPEAVERLWKGVVEPRVQSHLMLDFSVRGELPKEVLEGTEATGQLRMALTLVSSLGLMPPAFPFKAVLVILEGEEVGDKKARYLEIGLGLAGVSYGMASAAARHSILPPGSFWVSASGVKKGEIPSVLKGGMQLVVGLEDSLPLIWRAPGVNNRPSIETFESARIRQRCAEVREDLVFDLLHAHGWITRVPKKAFLQTVENASTCGSRELAEATAKEAAEVLRKAPRNAKIVVIALNQLRHGFTIIAGTQRHSETTGMTVILDLLTRGVQRSADGIWFTHKIPQPV